MAKVLMLTHVLPYPLDAGPKVRAYHMLRHLAARHDVTLVSWMRPDDRPESLAHLRGICGDVLTAPLRRSTLRNVRAGLMGPAGGRPMVIARDDDGQMAATLRGLAREQAFDVVHADQLSMAGWGQLAVAAARRRPATLLDEHNAIYLLTRRMAGAETRRLRRWLTWREAAAFGRYERAMCRDYDAVLTVTAEDCGHLLALYGPGERAALERKFTVVPICVDPTLVQPVQHRAGPPTIVHLGTMFWPPNAAGVLWFAREVLPLIRRQAPAARFVVVGKNPPAEVQALAADPQIEITGYVADPRPYLEAADVFVVPLHAAGGMRVKILDAWLWGLPIVSTPIGAEGIEAREGENLLIAPDATGFAEHTLRALCDPELNRRLRANGRAWVEERYGWQSVYERVDGVYAGLLKHDTGARGR